MAELTGADRLELATFLNQYDAGVATGANNVDLDQLEKTVKKIVTHHTAALEDERARLREDYRSLHSENSQLKNASEDLIIDLDKSDDELERVKDDLAEEENLSSDLNEQVEILKENLSQEETKCSEIFDEAVRYKRERIEYKEKYEGLKEKLAASELHRRKSFEAAVGYKEKYENLVNITREAEENLTLMSYNGRLVPVNSTGLREVIDEATGLRWQLKRAEDRVKSLENIGVADLFAERDSARKEVERLQAQEESVRNHLSAAFDAQWERAENLQFDNTELKKKVKALKNVLRDAQAEVERQRDVMTPTQAELFDAGITWQQRARTTADRLTEAKNEIKSFKEALDQAWEREDEIIAEVNEWSSKYHETHRKLQEAQEVLAQEVAPQSPECECIGKPRRDGNEKGCEHG